MHAEPDLDRLLAEGSLHGSDVSVISAGGDCHANVAKLWIDGEIDAVGTGYALQEGLWRQHSRGVDGVGTVLETKVHCERYVRLTLRPGEPTVQFALANYGRDIKQILQHKVGRAKEIVDVLRGRRAQPWHH